MKPRKKIVKRSQINRRLREKRQYDEYLANKQNYIKMTDVAHYRALHNCTIRQALRAVLLNHQKDKLKCQIVQE